MKKEGYLLENRTVKIVLVAILAVVLILVVVFWLSLKNNKELAEIEDGGTTLVPSDQGEQITKEIEPSEAKQSPSTDETKGLISGQFPPVNTTPFPGSGVFDWTRANRITIISPSMEIPIDKMEAMRENDICKLMELSDSWSDPFQKFLCDSTKFTSDKLLNSIYSLACSTYAAAINLNYDSNIKLKFINGQCIIEDR